MSESNDPPTRRRIFNWIARNEDVVYAARAPIHPIGVYFSPSTRNYFAADFVPSFRGLLILLMQKHLEYQIVTPRSLASFHSDTLVLPDVRTLDAHEQASLRAYVASGKNLVVNGTDAAGLAGAANVVRFPNDPGRDYMTALLNDFEHATPDMEHDFLAALKPGSDIVVKSSPTVVAHIARVGEQDCVFIANFGGLRGHVNPVQRPETGMQVVFADPSKKRMRFVPFLGETQELQGKPGQQGRVFDLPPVEKGAVACVGEN